MINFNGFHLNMEAKMEEELSRLDVEAEEETPVEEIDKVIEAINGQSVDLFIASLLQQLRDGISNRKAFAR
ncbi:hypothetical protein LCGC14_2766490 [marine sediment metagenome]|uniref:Uncharacterized protein n=1 Tax=marine sediment metagenome TaxID=412755 RepID=A0A0F8YXD3_9ZZZZ